MAQNEAVLADVVLATRAAELRALSDTLQRRDEIDRRQARQSASLAGFPMRRELPDGRVLELQRIDPRSGPVFYITNNVDAADTVSTDEVWPGGSAGLDLDGSGMTVAQWDAGAIYAHDDFFGRLTQVDGATVVSGHSTHVAGTLIGSGNGDLPDARGMVYAADLNAYDWNSDTSEMSLAAAAGQLVSNHSYGIAAGWLYIGGVPPDNWWWIGGETDLEDPNFGYYDAESQLWDQIANNAPYYLIVKASGNDHTDVGPPPGELYSVINQNGDLLFTSTLSRPADCAPAGYDCLPTHSVAKNILTVGAVDDVPGGYSPLAGPASVVMADFSSWGPTDDGRIKPDLVGNGMFLLSTWHESPFFAAAAGTSMAAPNITGSLLLLQEHYQNIHGSGNFMRAATLKGLAIHTADEAGDAPGPDYAYGWGLLNTKSAAEVISEDGGDHQIIEGSLTNGGSDSMQVSVSLANAVLSATLVWSDPAATPVDLSLDPTDLMLVNDLDLRITRGAATYQPWVLNPASPAAAATTGDNFRDNVEQVEVIDGGTGMYTVEVTHKGVLLNNQNQDYSLIISINPGLPTGGGLLIDEDFSGGLPAGWSINTLMGVSWTIKTPVPGGSRLDNNTGGTGQFAMVDNGYIFQTVTSLQMPQLDLSAADAAVLRFKSQYIYDTFESLNVDASTDGGSNWFTVWQYQGFNPFPTNYVLDLSAAIAGEPSVILRFRFDSEGFLSGDYWQIDDIELEVFGAEPASNDPPVAVASASPLNGDTPLNVSFNGSGSSDSDGSIVSYDWTFGDGGSDTGSTPSHIYIAAGNYTATLTVTDNDGDADIDTVLITVSDPLPNLLPTAVASATPLNGDAPLNVSFDGTGSSDSDGSIVSWEWTFGDGGSDTGSTPNYVYTSAGNYTASLTVTDDDGATAIDSLLITVSDPPPPPPETDHLASADIQGAGSVNRSYIATHEDDEGAIQSITERQSGGRKNNRYSYSEHTWAFNISAGATTIVYANAWSGGSSDGDSFIFEWSTSSNSGFQPLFTVDNSSNSSSTQSAPINASGAIFIRVRDTDQTAGNKTLDTVYIDHLFIRTTIAEGDPPAAPSGMAVSGPTSSSLELNWLDNSADESSFTLERSTDGTNFSLLIMLGANVTSHTDTGLSASTTYWYRVYASNASGSSATSAAASGTTLAGSSITLSANGYKIKGKHNVDLDWSGSAASDMDIYRDNMVTPIATTANDGTYTDAIDAKGGASYIYKVCEAGTGICSDTVNVVF